MNISRAILGTSAVVVTVVSAFAFKSSKNTRHQLFTNTQGTTSCRLADCYTVPAGGSVDQPCTSGITYYSKLTATNHKQCTKIWSGLATAND